MPRTTRSSRTAHFSPELMTELPGPWECHLATITESKVSLELRKAYIPPPLTETQQKIRMHEGWHVKMSPRDWLSTRTEVMRYGDAEGLNLDSDAVMKLSKMLEETRIDWTLWDRRKIDMRSSRESLNWDAIPVPDDDPLEATCMMLQLAWTVWGSNQRWHHIDPNMPPVREVGTAVATYFDACTRIIREYDSSLPAAITKAFAAVIVTPDHTTRNEVAYELAKFFIRKHESEPPPPTEEEAEAQAEAEQMLREEQQAQEEDESGGDHNDVQRFGHYEIHDHTIGPRRPTVKVRKKFTPVDLGTVLKYPHRYLMDRTMYGRRNRQTGSIMIDMSGSMRWTNDDMMGLLDRMPGLWIAGYVGRAAEHGSPIIGRICIHAKNGRFNVYTGREIGSTGSNTIDLEALKLLALQPEPRFWLSDGLVNSGVLQGQRHPEYPPNAGGSYFHSAGRLIYEVNKVMKNARIIRIGTKDDMVDLFKRRRVTVYRNTVADDRQHGQHGSGWVNRMEYPEGMTPSPMSYQL